MRTLQDRVAVITGAGSGIGRELALELARRGATIAAVDVRPEGIEETARLVRAIGPSVSDHVADVAEADGCRHFLARSLTRMGPVTS
ncbi:MAG: SDR family NAD(P)-dependent oxidoreductase [Marmoricola sp.]